MDSEPSSSTVAAAPTTPLPRGVGPLAVAFVALAQLTPLVCAPTLSVWPFVAPKSLFLVLVSAPLVALALLLAAATRGRVRPRSGPIVWTLALFAASLVVSTLFSVDRHRSMFDDLERMLGTFQLLHVVALGLAAIVLIRRDAGWRFVWWVTFVVSVVVSGCALWQRVEPEFLFNIGGWRVSSTMNHPAFLGGYAVRTALLGWLLLGRERGGLRLLAGAAGLLGIAAALASETRSALLALGAGGAVVVVGTILTSDDRRARRVAVAALVLAMAAAGAMLPLLGLEEERSVLRHRVQTGVATTDDEGRLATVERLWEWTTKVPGLRRFTRMSVTKKTASTRLMTWEIAIEAGRARPLVGWGPCNYASAFEVYYRPEFLAHGRQETWFDHAHSVPLDAFATRGVPGLLTQLALFLVPLVVLRTAYRRRRVEARFAVAAAAVLVAHFTHLLFVFDGASSWVGLVVFLAYLHRETGPSSPSSPASPAAATTGPSRPIITAAALAIGIAWGGGWAAPEWRTMHEMQEALDRLEAGEGEPAAAAFRRAVAGDPPHADGARNMFATGVLRQTERVGAAAPPALARVCELAFDALGENRVLHPRDARVVLRRAELARELAARFSDPSRIGVVVSELEQARRLSPNRQELVFLLAELGPSIGRSLDELESLLRGAAVAEPAVGEAWLRLAMLQIQAGRPDRAAPTLREGLTKGARFTAPERRAVDAILEKDGH